MTKSWKIQDGVLPNDLKDHLSEYLQRTDAASNFGPDSTPLPLWLAFPDHPKTSMFWRMASGETCRDAFRAWISNLDNNAQQEYIAKYPEPKEWEGFYMSILKVD